MAEAHEAGAKRRRGSAVVSARRDIITGGVTVAAILLFVGTGSNVVGNTVKAISGVGGGADQTLVVALLLNIALILFGWRRYADLSREVKERSAAEERARELASKDPLTGFLNRRSLAETGAAMLARADRRQKCVAMLMLDLDNFKNVNDMHGHAAGDALLKSVSAEIEKAMPPVSLAARLGGDEFACAFLFDPSSPETVNRVAQKIVSRLSQPFDAGGIHTHISVSVGIARSEIDCDTIEALMRRADIAMYAAKNSGRNRYCWFDSSMERALQMRNAIEAGLRSGIPKGEFVPYYEQQIDLTTGRLHGFEVLARWDSPNQGLVSPEQFVPVAEETGMIGDLSMSVIRQAMEHGRDWDPSLTLSVNISPGQLKDPWLAQKLVKLLVETGYPAHRLEVEITESSLFENLVLAQSIVGSLKNQGIKLALDDFGTGYSSLAHLRALPFDRIKIDRSFVSSINDNPESAAIVNAITRLGDSLGLPVTAEGIEDAEIEQRLRVLGVHKGQGWHFGKPMPVGQVRKLLADKNLLPAARHRTGTSKSDSVRTFRQAG
ncbi:bifunctional diguanylate cyclase/phosphodiesterase [Sphingomonas sp. LaA6.9]|uniref:putative bifunctional diguanylate cyclase/phosphodiesterase n=1 Tax=Sphingomonas sp. LaA6.9 TaxID=2919914 RepID=UPI001F500D8C|nr:EAL domain-containing protein [Sphingomonas sp. LaA6.9]MCJ8157836.1 EAL domain-containing protein [Sphingomonas sp. LaA6.9]